MSRTHLAEPVACDYERARAILLAMDETGAAVFRQRTGWRLQMCGKGEGITSPPVLV
jgi:hypothetical protein